MNEKDLKPSNMFLGCKWGKVKIRFVKPIAPSPPRNPHTEKNRKESKDIIRAVGRNHLCFVVWVETLNLSRL